MLNVWVRARLFVLDFSSNKRSRKDKYFFVWGITCLDKGRGYPLGWRDFCNSFYLIPLAPFFFLNRVCALFSIELIYTFAANCSVKVCTSSPRAQIKSKHIFEFSKDAYGFKKLLTELHHSHFWAFTRTSELVPLSCFYFSLKSFGWASADPFFKSWKATWCPRLKEKDLQPCRPSCISS